MGKKERLPIVSMSWSDLPEQRLHKEIYQHNTYVQQLPAEFLLIFFNL